MIVMQPLRPSILILAVLMLVSVRESTDSVEASGSHIGRIEIISGITDQRVLQRGSDGRAAFQVSGCAWPSADSALAYRVLRRQQVVQGFDWRRVSLSPDGKWDMRIEGLPTGGPFRFEFKLTDAEGNALDQRDIDGVLVGDLWILTGQSNMDGAGLLDDAERPSEMVHAYSLANTWQVAEDPMHLCSEAAYAVYRTSYVTPTERRPVPPKTRGTWPAWQKGPERLGAGLGIPFGKRIHKKTGVPIGLVLCSLGGTTMLQWSPDLKDEGENSLYGAMLERLDKVGGRVAGILWYQGESDSYGEGVAPYEERLTRLVASIRSDFKQPNLPFYTVQIGRQLTGRTVTDSGKDIVREAQRKCMRTIPNAGLVTSIDCAMSSGAHLDTVGYKRVGRRLAHLALADVYGRKDIKAGPRLESVRIESDHDFPYGHVVRVTFAEVNGRLRASLPVSGFTIVRVKPDGSRVQSGPTSVEIDATQPDSVLIRTTGKLPAEAYLYYGRGWDPICNLVDEMDMAVPAFGPIRIEQKTGRQQVQGSGS